MKRLFTTIIILLTFITLSFCDSTIQLINQKSNSIKMDRNKDILVTTARNGY